MAILFEKEIHLHEDKVRQEQLTKREQTILSVFNNIKVILSKKTMFKDMWDTELYFGQKGKKIGVWGTNVTHGCFSFSAWTRPKFLFQYVEWCDYQRFYFDGTFFVLSMCDSFNGRRNDMVVNNTNNLKERLDEHTDYWLKYAFIVTSKVVRNIDAYYDKYVADVKRYTQQ